ncbi:PiggyBac transposable element-derived protein 3 [Acipenser ruthenus]|uniref:PiggyBac transposable element-derived protein 3 n=1 Tax=Acipenser ruthenus TaxID=7906 RepID=A0A444UQ61_ACIRT|nr:PiggyBac transposable element-derived protein 3 [Acipenser ruthenus]
MLLTLEKTRRPIWNVGKENNHATIPPPSSGEHKMNIDEEEPVGLFLQLVHEDFLQDMVFQSNLYAMQHGSASFNLNDPELKTFLGINFVMTYIRYAHPDLVTDGLWKIKSFLDKLAPRQIDVEEQVSVDEMMIPFKGRTTLKQYIKGSGGNHAPVVLGVVPDVVVRLCGDLHYKEVQSFGTIRRNRLMGCEKKLTAEKELKRRERGSVSFATSNDNITIVCWQDNAVVHVASSFTGVQPTDKAIRWSKKDKAKVQIDRPNSMKMYNHHMGGVDKMDHLNALYCQTTRRKRGYMHIFYHF